MYVVVNKIPSNPHMITAFKQAAPDMKKFAGFLGLEIWEGADGSLQAVSRWTTKEALDEYTSTQTFQQHHSGASGQHEQASDHSSAHYNSEVII